MTAQTYFKETRHYEALKENQLDVMWEKVALKAPVCFRL